MTEDSIASVAVRASGLDAVLLQEVVIVGGDGGKALDGAVTDKRNMEGGKAGVTAEGAKAGDTYTVTFTRKLAGGVNLAAGKAVPFGVAVHADNAGGRFHHVSFGHTLGLGADGDVKAVKQ